MYELLLIKGESKASDLVPESGLGRGNVYNLLTALVSMGLATVTAGKQLIYRAAEPTKLVKLVEAKRIETDRLEAEFKEELPKLSSTFNLTTGRPAIQVFEGYEGAEEALMDSLRAKTDILTYYDFEALHGQFVDLDQRYYKKYVAKGLTKRVITSDTPSAQAYFKDSLQQTEIAFVPQFPMGTQAATQIYDDTIAFISIKDDKLISVLIHDALFANMLRQQFEYIWSQAASVKKYSQDNAGEVALS